MNNIVEDVFLALTSFDVNFIKKVSYLPKYSEHRMHSKIEGFRQLMKDYRIDDYIDPLYHYMVLVKERQRLYLNSVDQDYENETKQLKQKKRLIKLLKIFSTGNGIHSITIHCSKILKEESFNVIDTDTINLIVESALDPIWEKVEELDLNKVYTTREKAIDEINKRTDCEWIKKWMESMGYVDPNYPEFSLDKFDDYFQGLEWRLTLPGYPALLKEQLISEYIYDHAFRLPRTVETIEKILAQLENVKSKGGRLEDTLVSKQTAFELMILKHAEDFLKNHAIEFISDIPLSDDDHDFIHDVLVYFGLMNTYKDTSKNKENLKKNIRKMIIAFKDPLFKKEIDEKFYILKQEN